jgi:hypothetical protein
MSLFTFSPPPGLFNDGTAYSTKGVWFAADKVRFRGGFPEKIGGWTKLTTSVFDGVCRSLIQWVDLSGVRHIGVGTNSKYYIESSGAVLADKTPLRAAPLGSNPLSVTNASTTMTVAHRAHGQAVGDRVILAGAEDTGGLTAAQLNDTFVIASTPTVDTYTVTLPAAASSTVTGGGALVTALYSSPFTSPMGNNPFETTDLSADVVVNHVNHGCKAGDFVTFDGASAVGGITIDGEYSVTSVTSVDEYVVTHSSAATSTTTGGGAAVTAEYYLSIGLANFTTSIGWGSGGWGVGGWGESTSSGFGNQIRLWSVASFGEDLVINPRGGAIYFYDTSEADRAYNIRLLSTAAEAPTAANYIVVTPEDRRVVAFGCTDPNTGLFDPLLIRWCDNEDLGNWDPADISATAGFIRLSSGSEIVCAAKSRQEILVWTEGTLSALRFVEDLIFSLTLLSPNIDILGPNTVMSVDDSVFWMGRENFFIYNGRVQVMPCAVRQYVFGDINLDQAFKVTASSNRLFREVRWDYPSSGSVENDRYVVFNYAENVWYFGTMERTAWSDAGITNYPIAASPDGYIYYHEFGWDDGSTNPTSALEAYVESSPIELEDGEHFSFVRRIIPDITFGESTASSPSVTYSITPSNWPGGPRGAEDEGTTTRTAALPVEEWTEKMDVRMRGRQFSLKVLSDTKTGVKWRLGKQRFDVRPDGRR